MSYFCLHSVINLEKKMSQPEMYTNSLSVFPGEDLDIFISAKNSPCNLTISRVTGVRTRVFNSEGLVTNTQSTPQNCSEVGCGWEKTTSIKVQDHWPTGYYDMTLRDSKGNISHHFFVVKAKEFKARSVLVLATNTYHAYNYWGGFNSYANVDGLMQGKMDLPKSQTQAIGNLSAERPFSQNIINFPTTSTRLINSEKRKFNEQPFVIDPAMANQTEFSPFDGSAGFINKWEHVFVSWAEKYGVGMDFLTDKDLNDDIRCLDNYKTVIVAGHSEYWSSEQRDCIDRYVETGGNLCLFTGNTSYWKVRWENHGKTMVAHKWNGHKNDPLWQNPATRKKATHLWSHPEFGRPESETIGLSFLYGGYHRMGNCVSKGQAGFTVYDENHWALEGADLFYGDIIGDEIPLVGYESDGCPMQFDDYGKLVVQKGKGFPENLQIIAKVPTVMGEPSNTSYAPTLPPEHMDAIARIKFGGDSPDLIDKARIGHAVIASFTKGKGEVFNTGTTEWVHGLATGEPHITKMTLNILRKFGALDNLIVSYKED